MGEAARLQIFSLLLEMLYAYLAVVASIHGAKLFIPLITCHFSFHQLTCLIFHSGRQNIVDMPSKFIFL